MLIEEHLLCASQFEASRYQSLTGKLYTYESASKNLRCVFGSKKEITVLVQEQDVCYTTDGQLFQRFLCDEVLDERWHQRPQQDATPTTGPKQPPFESYQTADK